MSRLLFTKKGVTRIPKGYQWCEECDSLTPFVKEDEEKRYSNKVCLICGSREPYDGCDNCGARLMETEPMRDSVQIHEPGCHFREEPYNENVHTYDPTHAETIIRDFSASWMGQARSFNTYRPTFTDLMNQGIYAQLERRLNEEKRRKCNCRSVKIYSRADMALVTEETHPYYSMDCMNAVTWDYTLRCPICGYLNRRSDDSC